MPDQPNLIDSSSKSVKTVNVPETDIDFGSVVKKVKEKWNLSTWLTLQYLTSAQFAVKSDSYLEVLNARIEYGKSRPQVTNSLANINKEIDTRVSNVKGYIADKYGKENATSYYPAFGIDFNNKSYSIARDQNTRLEALQLMANAIVEHDFIDKTYGQAFWEGVKTKFTNFLENASQLDASVSSKVGDKNILKKELKKALNSIVLIVKANYPENYKQELRVWGFQKEKY